MLPLFLALWHCCDIGLDINQSITYYEMAFDVNTTYADWALQYQIKTNSTYLEKVSPGYFCSAVIVWIVPPLLSAIFFTLRRYHDYPNKRKIMITILLLPFTTVLSSLFMYLYFPISLCYTAVCEFCARLSEYNYYATFNFYNNKKDIQEFTKFIEILGEALPQLILNVVFIANNFPYLMEQDIYFGIPVPVSVISSVFSVGSLLIGFIKGIPILIKRLKSLEPSEERKLQVTARKCIEAQKARRNEK